MTNPPGGSPFDLGSMINAAVDARVADSHAAALESPEHKKSIIGTVFAEMGQLFRHVAHSFIGVKPDEFLTPPLQLPDGSCLVLVNKTCPVPNAFYLLATLFPTDDGTGTGTQRINRTVNVWAFNEADLASSNFIQLNTLPPEYVAELHRQLDAIMAAGADVNGNITLAPRLFTMLHIPQAIQGYTYYTPPTPPAANDDTGDAGADQGNTPAPTSDDTSGSTTIANGGTSDTPTDPAPAPAVDPTPAPVTDTPAAPVATDPAASSTDTPASPVDSSTPATPADPAPSTDVTDQSTPTPAPVDAPVADPVAAAPTDAPAAPVTDANAPAADPVATAPVADAPTADVPTLTDTVSPVADQPATPAADPAQAPIDSSVTAQVVADNTAATATDPVATPAVDPTAPTTAVAPAAPDTASADNSAPAQPPVDSSTPQA